MFFQHTKGNSIAILPSLRALWKIDLHRISSLVKYRQNQTKRIYHTLRIVTTYISRNTLLQESRYLLTCMDISIGSLLCPLIHSSALSEGIALVVGT